MQDIAVLGIEVKTDSVRRGTTDLDNLKVAGGGAEKATDGLTRAFTGLAGAMSLAEMARAVDSWQTLNSQLNIATGSINKGAEAYQQVLRIATATGQSLEGVGAIYGKLAQSAAQIGMSQSQVATTTETVAKAMALSGASALSSEAAIRQFGQALSSGALRGDELNSILENAPALAKAMADGLGVPVGKLRELGEQGQLTSVAIADAMSKVASKVDKDFAQMPLTMSRALQNMKTEWVDTMGGFESSTGAFGAMAKGVDLVAKNMDALGVAGAAVAAVYGGRMLSSMVTATTASVAKAAANRAELASTVMVAEASVVKASALVRETAIMGANVVATDALIIAENRLAAAKLAAAAASRGAMVLGALGGPIGIVTTALTLGATAWMLWKDNTESATATAASSAIQNLDSVIAKIEEMNGKLDQTNRRAYNNIVESTASEAKTVAAEITRLQNQLDSLDVKGGRGRFSDEGKAAQAQLNTLAAKEIELQKQLGKARAESSQVGTAALTKFIDANAVGADKVRVTQQKLLTEFATAIQNTGGVFDGKNKMHADALRSLNAGLADAASKNKPDKSGESAAKKAHNDQVRENVKAADSELDALNARNKMADEAAKANTSMAQTIDNLSDAYSRQNAVAKERSMSVEERELAAALRQVEEQADRAREALSAKAATLSGDNVVALNAFREAIAKVGEAESAQMAAARANHEERMAQNRDWRTGLSDSMKKYEAESLNVAQTAEQAFTKSFSSMEDALVEFATTGKVSFGDLAKSMIADLLRIQAKAVVLGMAKMFNFGGSEAAITAGSLYGPPKPNALGGIYQSPSLHSYVNQIHSKTTPFAFANGGVFGESGPEAIMPLKRDSAGRLGVSSGGSGVAVQIINNTGQAVTQKEVPDGRGGRQLQVTVGDMVASEMMRPGSSANRARSTPSMVRR